MSVYKSGMPSRDYQEIIYFFDVFSVDYPVASDSFPLAGSVSVSTPDGVYIAAN